MTESASDEPLFFDRSGAPIGLARYAELHSDPQYRILAAELVGARVVVTAWIGLDQGLGGSLAPLIFGTVALEADGQLWQAQERFAATEEQALLNHRQRVAELS